MKKLLMLFGLMGIAISTSGCLLGVAAGAGAVAADEAHEDDGFDPLEEAYDDDSDTTPIVKEDEEDE